MCRRPKLHHNSLTVGQGRIQPESLGGANSIEDLTRPSSTSHPSLHPPPLKKSSAMQPFFILYKIKENWSTSLYLHWYWMVWFTNQPISTLAILNFNISRANKAEKAKFCEMNVPITKSPNEYTTKVYFFTSIGDQRSYT